MKCHNPDFLFLAETKSSDVCAVLRNIGFFHFVAQPPIGRKGGLLFAWRLGVDVEVVSVNENAINTLMYSNPSISPWLLSGIYGPTEWEKKPHFWQFLRSTASAFVGPWLCIGDFNCIIDSSEKRGGAPLCLVLS